MKAVATGVASIVLALAVSGCASTPPPEEEARAPETGAPLLLFPITPAVPAQRFPLWRIPTRFGAARLPDPVWQGLRPSVNPFPLYDDARTARMLADGPSAPQGRSVTALVTSEDGPAVLAAYRFEF